MLVSAALAQGPSASSADPAPAPVPAFRQADHIAVIVVQGPIDRWTAHSVERRIQAAEAGGANALCFELNTPGGEVDAVLRITNAIKASSISNTVAWVRPDAYSGGALIALACREIVVADPAAIGDAFQVIPTFGGGRAGLRAPTADERTKILPVIMSDVVDSARRNGYDEALVQAMVIDGVELWLVEHTPSGRRYCVDEREYRALFAADPPRTRPMLTGVTGGRYQATGEGPSPDTAEPFSLPPPPRRSGVADGAPAPEPTPDARRFRPAGKHLDDIAEAFENESTRLDLEIATETSRPYFGTLSEADRAEYQPLGYVCDGTSAVVLHTQEAVALALAARVVKSDAELLAFFGAKTMARSHMVWSEHVAAFLTNPVVRGVLIVVFLLALFIEMVSPGLIVPITVSLLALAGLIGPPMLVGMAGWWEIVAIAAGLALVGIEVFVLPGFGLFGVLGVISLFVGLVGTFIPTGPSATPTDGLAWGATTVLLALITSGIGMYFIAKHAGSIPLLSRLILSDSAPEDSGLLAFAPTPTGPQVGDTGTTLTPLRPVGQAEFDSGIADVTSDAGFVDAGRPVRVTANDRFRILVEPAEDRA